MCGVDRSSIKKKQIKTPKDAATVAESEPAGGRIFRTATTYDGGGACSRLRVPGAAAAAAKSQPGVHLSPAKGHLEGEPVAGLVLQPKRIKRRWPLVRLLLVPIVVTDGRRRVVEQPGDAFVVVVALAEELELVQLARWWLLHTTGLMTIMNIAGKEGEGGSAIVCAGAARWPRHGWLDGWIDRSKRLTRVGFSSAEIYGPEKERTRS